MAIVTLTTDWERHDYYVAALKGEILRRNAAVTIVDISHFIPTYQLQAAAYILRGAYHHFPANSVHVIGVDSEPTARKPIVAIKYDGHFFVSADNGVLGLICEEDPDAVVSIEHPNRKNGFNALTPLAEAAAALSKGISINSVGAPKESINRMPMLLPTIDSSYILGNVIYIDTFGNIISNITRKEFDRVGKGRRYNILVQSNRYRIGKLSESYHDVEAGDFVALFNSAGHLEIAQNKGQIATILNLEIGAAVRIDFYNQ